MQKRGRCERWKEELGGSDNKMKHQEDEQCIKEFTPVTRMLQASDSPEFLPKISK